MYPIVVTSTILGTILLLSIVVYGDNHEALIFDRVDGTLFHLPTKQLEGKCGAWATACAADPSKSEDKEFIKDFSIAKTPLFVRRAYSDKNDISQVKQNICEKPFRLSLIFNTENLFIEFGYEVYYMAKESRMYYTSEPATLKSLDRAIGSLRDELKDQIIRVHGIYDKIRGVFKEEDKTKFYYGTKMNLMWMPMFKLKYDFLRLLPTKVMYEIRQNNTWPLDVECRPDDYVLGNETYERFNDDEGNVDVDKLYENQVEVFKNVKLPQLSCPSAEPCQVKENTCDSDNSCLKKRSLIPIDQFHLYPNSSLSCSNMTTVPIWNTNTSAEKQLKKLDRFIFALYRYVGSPIHIVAGAIGTLKLPTKSIFSSPKIYMDPKNKRIPVPNTIYKIIKYTVPNCEPNKDICKYSAIVFIHNDPNFNSSKKMCKDTEDVTISGGWTKIAMDDELKVINKNIYVCRYDEKVLKKIFEGWFSMTKEELFGKNLSLTSFPVLNKDGRIDVDTSIEKKVIEKFDELAKRQGDIKLDELISVPPANFAADEGEPDFIKQNETVQSSSQQQ